jgi:hypothetical protein
MAASCARTCIGQLVSRLVLDHFISWFDREATISSSRPNFGWPLRGEAVRVAEGYRGATCP